MRWLLAGLLIVLFHLYLLAATLAPSVLTGKPTMRMSPYPLSDLGAVVSVLWMAAIAFTGLGLVYRQERQNKRAQEAAPRDAYSD